MKVALLYDFDKTLAYRDMQEYGYIESLGYADPNDFWSIVTHQAQSEVMDSVLAYMYEMVKQSKAKCCPVTRELLAGYGSRIDYYPGVADWFGEINAIGRAKGIEVEHYIVSSGLKEIIEATSIAPYFTRIYACEFLYDQQGEALWPKMAINYTGKTQFLYRINKGILDISNDRDLNKYTAEEDRPIPFTNMIYFGDGLTDVPSMKLVKTNGGHAIAVYDPTKQLPSEMSMQLFEDKRVDFVAQADYRPSGRLQKIVASFFDVIASETALRQYQLTAQGGTHEPSK